MIKLIGKKNNTFSSNNDKNNDKKIRIITVILILKLRIIPFMLIKTILKNY